MTRFFTGHNGCVYHIYNFSDQDGNPAGGGAGGPGISIVWQNGPIRDATPNGALVEDNIQICIDRIEFYEGEHPEENDGRFACAENAAALFHLREAHRILLSRTKRRTDAGIEGQHIEDPRYQYGNYNPERGVSEPPPVAAVTHNPAGAAALPDY